MQIGKEMYFWAIVKEKKGQRKTFSTAEKQRVFQVDFWSTWENNYFHLKTPQKPTNQEAKQIY